MRRIAKILVSRGAILRVKQDVLEIAGGHVLLQTQMLQEPAQVKVMVVLKNGNMEVIICHRIVDVETAVVQHVLVVADHHVVTHVPVKIR